jgi:LPXTG-site transpeptidase (sortase) family protein
VPRWRYRSAIAFGLLVMAGAGAWQLNATLWSTNSRRAGEALVHQFVTRPTTATPAADGPVAPGMASLASCAAYDPANPVQGLLVIPKLGITAPVEQGVDDAQLDVAVGHNPNSVWPGDPGNAVLAAHDVSYFTHLPDLAVGDTVEFVTSCVTTVFAVHAQHVVEAGAPVYNTTGPTLTMVTCWPTNALWFTSQRYVVSADEVSWSTTVPGRLAYRTATPAPTVPVPAALAAEGVTLTTYSLPMGTLTISGDPDPSWAQTTSPLLTEGSGVSAFIAGMRALTENRLDWWSAVAPGVAPPAALVGAGAPRYLSSLQVSVEADKTGATGVALTITVSVGGGPAPGRYAVTVHETVANDTLVIGSFTITPA